MKLYSFTSSWTHNAQHNQAKQQWASILQPPERGSKQFAQILLFAYRTLLAIDHPPSTIDHPTSTIHIHHLPSTIHQSGTMSGASKQIYDRHNVGMAGVDWSPANKGPTKCL